MSHLKLATAIYAVLLLFLYYFIFNQEKIQSFQREI